MRTCESLGDAVAMQVVLEDNKSEISDLRQNNERMQAEVHCIPCPIMHGAATLWPFSHPCLTVNTVTRRERGHAAGISTHTAAAASQPTLLPLHHLDLACCSVSHEC